MSKRSFNYASEERMALREGSNSRNRMSVSRGAKRTIRPTTYEGTGNLARYIMGIFPGETKTTYNLIYKRVQSHVDRTGTTPGKQDIRNMVRELIH